VGVGACLLITPRGLRRRSAAARSLGMRVLIPLKDGCLSVESVMCCQAEFSAKGRSLIQRSLTEGGVPDCDL
jgi:hypothetical protein